MRYIACTAFSEEGYEQYGRKFIETFLRHWTIPIWVHTDVELGDNARVFRVPPDRDADLQAFLQTYGIVDCPALSTVEGPVAKDYRWRATKFAYKVFAYTGTPFDDKLIWLDADIVTHEDVDEAFLDRACPNGLAFSYLGRTGWHTSECGFMGFDKHYGSAFLKRMREVYTSGEIFEHMEWHDSYIFDRVREEFEAKHDVFAFNLSKGLGGLHVFDDCLLGEKMRHLKGPLRKKGLRPDGLPDAYWSSNEQVRTAT